MSPLDAFWHLLGFAAVPMLVGLLAAGTVKVVWRRPLAGLSMARLALRTTGTCLAVALAGLAATGRDGAIVTYAAMVVACALVLWWPLRR